MKYDVAIIGAGITGAALARELSKYELNIILLEKEIEPAFGVSKSNSGIIHSGTQNPSDSLKGKLCVEGNRLMREEIAKDLGLNFIQCGQLITAFDEEEKKKLFEIKQEGEKLGVPGLEIKDRQWLDKNEPNLSKEVIAALFSPSAGIISPYRYVYALIENATDNGVILKTESKVLAIEQKGPKDFEIKTEKEYFKTSFVVNCAGLYAQEIAEMIGIKDIKIVPRKGEEYLLDKKRENISNHIIFPLPSKNSKGILMIKTSDGNPMIGPTAHEIEDKEDLSTTENGLNEVLEGVKRMIPSVDKSDIIAYFAGLRPSCGKDFVIRYEKNRDGFLNMAGIQSPGLTAAPASAAYVADILFKNGLPCAKKKNFKKYRQRPIHLFQIPLSKTEELIQKDPSYGDIVCRCEMVSAMEIRQAIKRGAKTLDGIKFRTRAQAGRCHGGFCTSRIMKILSEELNISPLEITKKGKNSNIIKRIK